MKRFAYLPILKWKQAEFTALKDVFPAAKSRITPLIELPPVEWDYEKEEPKKTIDKHLEKVPSQLEVHWGTQDPVFIDAGLIEVGERMSDGSHPLAWVLKQANEAKTKAVPVTGPDRDPAYTTAVAEAVRRDKRGVCFRITADHLSTASTSLPAMLNALELKPEAVDLVADLGAVREDSVAVLVAGASALISALPYIKQWRSFTLASGGFPVNLSGITPGVHQIPRMDWTLWNRLVAMRPAFQRVPTFGDYAVQHPAPSEVDPRIMQMSANLRYTIDNHWVLIRGVSVRRPEGFEQFKGLCQQLIARPDFRGAAFSAGDKTIADCAAGKTSSGNATTWRRLATNHHLAQVVDQIARAEGLAAIASDA